MSTKVKNGVLFTVLALLVSVPSFASDGNMMDLVMIGRNVCINPVNEDVGCTDYGQRPQFRIEKAYGLDRVEIPELRGWVLDYMKTYRSLVLVHERNVGKRVLIRGRVYLPKKHLEVAFYRFEKQKREAKEIDSPTQVLSFYIADFNFQGTNFEVRRSSRNNVGRVGQSNLSGWRDGGKNFRGLATLRAQSSSRSSRVKQYR